MMNTGRKRKLRTWFTICLLLVCAIMTQLSHADQKTYEGSGWNTPEDAVLHYLDGLKEQDLDKMISAYAVESYIDHFDPQAYLERYYQFYPCMTPHIPNTDGFTRGIKEVRTGCAGSFWLEQCWGY